MTKFLKILFIGFAVVTTACSELPEYELPYELSPVTGLSVETDVNAANAICPGPTATFTVDSESTVYYMVQPEADEALTSDDVFDEGDAVSFETAGSKEVEFSGLEMGESYTLYAVTVNIDGIRTEAVTSTSFTMPSFTEVVDSSLATTDYVGTVSYNGSPFVQYDVTLSNDGSYVFTAESLWGDAIAGLTQVEDYIGMFQYPGTITLAEDFSLLVESEASYALGGEGTYDPCTGIFSYSLDTSLFDDPDTEEVEPLTVTVELAPAEAEEAAAE